VDVKAGMSQLTRDSQKTLSGSMVLALAAGKNALDEDIAIVADGKERLKTIEETIKRHGVPVEPARELLMMKPPPEGFDMDDVNAKIRALAVRVKDQPGLVADVLKFSIYGKVFAINLGFIDRGYANIKDVKIEGKQATGVATLIDADGKMTTEPVYFKREDGNWKLDLIETTRYRPEPPPRAETPMPRAEAPTPRYERYEPRPGPLRRLLQRLRGG
jgi:hypothetical protein